MARYKTITIVAAVPTFGYALGHFTTTAMLSGEANSLLFLRNTVGLVVGSGILWASMSVWAGRVAGPRPVAQHSCRYRHHLRHAGYSLRIWFAHRRLR